MKDNRKSKMICEGFGNVDLISYLEFMSNIEEGIMFELSKTPKSKLFLTSNFFWPKNSTDVRMWSLDAQSNSSVKFLGCLYGPATSFNL